MNRLPFAIQLAVASLVLLGILIVIGIDWRWASVTMAIVFVVALVLPREIATPSPRSLREGNGSSDSPLFGRGEEDDPVTRSDKRIVSAISCALAAATLLWASEHLAYEAVYAYQLAQAEQTWPKTDAVIVHSHVEESRGNSMRWAPVWDYSYTVNQERHVARSTDLASGSAQAWYETREQAEDAADDRPNGSRSVVYYDPSDPSHSALDRPDPAWRWEGITVAASFLLLGVLLAVMGLREFRMSKNQTT
ncbi:DUF3592 domain-containing protein [Ralstonia flaminis]|jgi:hypothetical protein|uniref:DUF3592 domain-containing protein n=1 Tax=Ralstonia flaminis TaxID=3058597 RepID=A0ABM9K5X7_9RALS|nr:DUF3592 domain-containing protein [Ralstonia sp. LMG 18101]CAJ0816550.1 hypothetical protein LMG18101_02973 [Ralstonia sp. LMG 18101]